MGGVSLPAQQRDDHVNSMLQLASWNTQGKAWTQTLQVLEDAEVDSHILALQECSLPKGDDGCAPPGDDNNPVACDVAHGYVVLVGKPSGCHRKLAFCVDESWGALWSSFQVGDSHISLQLQLTQMKFVLVNVHLPHSGRPLEDLHRACDSLIACLMPVVEKGLPMVLLGDLNYDVHRDDPSSERGFAICSMLEMLRLTIVHPSTVPTWRIRTIDYIICSPSFHAQVAMPCQEDGPWEEYDVRQDLKHILGVDHACLLGTSLVAHRRTGLAKTRRRAWKHVPRKMHVTQPHLVEEFVQKVGAGMEMRSFQCKVDGLVNLASAATAPRRPVRYVDPADVKGMCQERSRTSNGDLRRMLSFAISRAREAARHAWKRGLVLRAAGGDWQAEKQLTKRDSLHAAMWPMLMAHEGDKHAVVREVASILLASSLAMPLLMLVSLFKACLKMSFRLLWKRLLRVSSL